MNRPNHNQFHTCIVTHVITSILVKVVRFISLPNATWHSGTWPYTMTPSIDQTLHLFANLLPNWTLIAILNLLPNFGGFHRTLQRVQLANRGRLLLRTPGPVPFGTCICTNVETILSWTCHVYGSLEFRTSLGTSILLPLINSANTKIQYKQTNYDTDNIDNNKYRRINIRFSHWHIRHNKFLFLC